MKRTISILVFGLLTVIVQNLSAQMLLREIPLKQQIENSTLVIEGKVIAKESFWEKGLIYTSNTIEVYKVFKGNPIASIDVVTLGGTVDLKALIAKPSLKLRIGDVGVFALENIELTHKENKNNSVYRPYGSAQGFYKYNLFNDMAVNPFNKIQGITSKFHEEIKTITKNEVHIVTDFDSKKTSHQSKNALPPSGLSLNKSVVTAGTKEVLTITGSGFGGGKGKVWFSNADDGGATYISALDTEVLTWDETEITVEVPSDAGTGPVFIEDSGNVTSPLSSTLTVSYAEINVVYNPGSGDEAYRVQHVDDNGSGGYTWEMQVDFFNDTDVPGARAVFEKGFNEWVCQTGINWTISNSPTIVDVIGTDTNADNEADEGDDTNVIRFDNGNELDADVLGVCYSWYAGCGGAAIKWYVYELDIVFDKETNWYLGSGLPGSGQYDFESVVLHELGHGHQLGHVIDVSNDGNNMDDVMHYSLTNGEQQRNLSSNNITAASNIQIRSTGTMVCGETSMLDASCPLSVPDIELANAISLYPNPTTGRLYIKNDSFLDLEKVVIHDIGGRKISEYTITNTLKDSYIDLIGVANGLYFVAIYSETTQVTKRVILK